MKKIRFAVLATALIAFCSASCDKEYHCICIIKNKSGSQLAADTTIVRINKKSRAKVVCTALEFSKPAGTDSISSTCVLQ